jgi:hypothetical protein
MSRETAILLALTLEIILPRLAQCCVPDLISKFHREDADFQQFEFRSQQIAFVKDVAESRYKVATSINGLPRAFDCPRSRVKSALAHGLDSLGHRGEDTLSIKVVSGKSSMISDRTPKKTHQSEKERLGIIA